ncbi:MAG: hypothetical protein DCC68_00160 [Planctomycetota bacterium]|nr:MAG: hypothetical protein DCC68_00160 [Planctomycetota bacterium]
MLEDLQTKLHEQGRFCRFESQFTAFQNLTGETRRLLIAEVHRSRGGGTGRSFWLHNGSGITILGLWSGLEYHIMDESQAWEIVAGVLDGRLCMPAVTPSVVFDETTPGGGNVWPANETPRALQSRNGYAIRPFGALQLFPRDSGERQPESWGFSTQPPLSRDEFIQRLAPAVDECNLSHNGFVHIKLRTASALTRFHAGGTMCVDDLLVLMYESIRETDDEVSLLRTLIGTGCTAYDAWQNRVHLDDPYYALPSDGPRPDEPANASEE